MRIYYIFFWVLLVFVGCQKDIDDFEPYVQTAIEWPEVLNSPPIYKQFDATVDSKIDLGQGDVLFVPANTLVDGQGNLLSGKVDLSITMIHKKADLIYAYMNSNTETTQLDNYHTIKIKAFSNTHEVFIKANHSITLKSPSDKTIDDGSVWVGNFDSPNSFGWDASGTNSIFPASWEINGTSYTGLAYQTKKLGWISGGRAFSGATHELCVNLVEGYKGEKTKIYFVFDDQFSVAELKEFSDTKQFCANIPEGSKGHLIILNEEEKGIFRFQNEALTITEDITFTGQPIVTVLENIALKLNNL